MVDNRELALSALNFLDASCPREEWIRIGMSAKSAGLFFEDFHEWSKYGENYSKEKDCKAAWNSFKKTGGITERTLFGMAISKGWQDRTWARFNNGKAQPGRDARQTVNEAHKQSNETTNLAAFDIWERCLPALATHDYILRKQGKPHGLRYYPATESPLKICGENVTDYLVVPCWSNDELQTLQFIPSANSGNKLNLAGAVFNDGYFTIGQIGNLVYVCEGLGQAWGANKATGCGAVVCFGAGRMLTVAKTLYAKYPAARLVIVPDCGKERQAAEIAAAVRGEWIELPQDKPSNYDINDYAQEYGYESLRLLLERLKAPEMRYKLLSGGELFNAPPMKWIVRGVIPAEGLAALYGASGSGKSFLILDMAFAIASGQEKWFGFRISKVPVTYICLEGESGMGKRIKAWSNYFGKPVPDGLRFVTQAFNLLSKDVSELANAIIAARGNGGMVIIDTLNRAAPGADENSSVDMGRLIAAGKELQSLIGGIVLFVHHTGKDATKGLRGHSSLYAALDGAIEVVKTDSRREWSVAKSKDDVTGHSNPFKLEIVPIDIDAEGEEITSCVALFDGSIDLTLKKKSSLGRNQKIALEVVAKQLHNSPHIGMDGAPMFNKCIGYDEALMAVAERMPTDSKHRKSRAASAIAGLIERQYMGMKGDWLWKL